MTVMNTRGRHMFTGSIVALVTPFKNGQIDRAKLKELAEFHIKNGTDAIVSCGTTGESPTLSHEEDIEITRLMVEYAAGRVPVIAGTGSNNTAEAIYLTEAAKNNGASGALVVVPYYNKPTQEGMFQHFKKIAESVDIPIVLYNVPGRTGAGLQPDTVVRLSKVPGIVAIKEASGTVGATNEILRQIPDFTVLSGDDGITYPLMALGAKGVISVAANVIPAEMAKLCSLMLKGDFAEAKAIHYKYAELFDALFYESNPIPVKAAMSMMGLCEEEYRLPLVKMGDANRERLKQAMQRAGLI
jgi:4-hydroxy-tetrahydrodipicolinate synthase